MLIDSSFNSDINLNNYLFVKEKLMHHLITSLENVMILEKEIYEEIYNIEENKTEAIINRDGRAVEELSSVQEKFLMKIDAVENERIKIMHSLGKSIRSDNQAGEITLNEIISLIEGDYAATLKQTGSDLKRILVNIREVQDLNSQMMKDNMEYYDILISGLKNSSSLKSGYDKDGREKAKAFNPVLLNIKA